MNEKSFIEYLIRLIEKHNNIDIVYNKVLDHFTYTDCICFDSQLDRIEYCCEFIRYNNLHSFLIQDENYPINDDCFDRLGY